MTGVVGALAGLALVWVGGFYAATIGGERAAPADIRTGALVAIAGTLVAVATPVALAVRTHRWQHLLAVAPVLALVAYWLLPWPPVIDWTAY